MSYPKWLAGLTSSASLMARSQGAMAQDGPAAPSREPVQSGTSVAHVIVTAPRREARARATQYAAPNIVDVQSAETILKYPDFNSAEALGRIPGVSLSSDTGEGRFVNIRGLDANLNGATYGGVVLSTPIRAAPPAAAADGRSSLTPFPMARSTASS